MNAFHVCGALFAAWAVIVSFVGITREDFPASPAVERAVMAVSVLLTVATIGSAIVTSANEEEEEHGGEEQALVLRI